MTMTADRLATTIDNIDRRLSLVEQMATGPEVMGVETTELPSLIIDDGVHPPFNVDVRPPGDAQNITVTVGAFGDDIFADVDWDAPADATPTGGYSNPSTYEIELADKVGAAYNLNTIEQTSGTHYRFTALLPTHDYGVRFTTMSAFGLRGTPSAWHDFTTGKDTTLPGVPTGLSVFRGPSALIATWNRNVESDVDYGHGLYIAQASTDNFVANITEIRTSATVVSFDGINAEATYKVRVAAIDSSGNQGPWVTSGNILAGGIIETMLLANSVSQAALKDNIINNAKIVDDAINAAKIAVNAVGATEIAPDSISTGHLTAGAVQAGDIAANAVIAGNIAANAIVSTMIQADQITAREIGSHVVTANEIFGGTITANELGANSVTASKIAAGQVVTSHMTAGTIDGDRLQINSIDAGKIQSGTILTAALTVANNLTPGASGGGIIVGNPTANGLYISTIGIRGYKNSAQTFAVDASGNASFSGTISASTVNSTWFQCAGCGMYDNYGVYFLTGANGYSVQRALYWQDYSTSTQYWRMYCPNASQFFLERVNVLSGQYSEIHMKANSIYLKNVYSGATMFQAYTTSDGSRYIDAFGYFTATTVSAGVKNFCIDHPLAPEKKLLQHSVMEGPEIAVGYRGKAAVVNGEAVVELPDYFEALTRLEDRTVQLTAFGKRPVSLSASYPTNGRFVVYADEDVEFFWRVEAVRSDVPRLETEYDKQELAGAVAFLQMNIAEEDGPQEPNPKGAPMGRTLAQVQAGF